ncbi:hypothetical protein RB200_39275 [Streptomyces sp. PmtG]
MSERRRRDRSAVAGAAPLLVLRCAALFAVLVWVLPVCAHSADADAARPTAVSGGAAASVDPRAGTADAEPYAGRADAVSHRAAAADSASHSARDCPDMRHGPGEAHCRPATGAPVATASPAPAASPLAADATAVPWTPDPPSARGAPADLSHTPGIHQLQVQRT